MITKMITGIKSSAAGTAFSLAILRRFMMVVAQRNTHLTLSLGVCRKKHSVQGQNTHLAD